MGILDWFLEMADNRPKTGWALMDEQSQNNDPLVNCPDSEVRRGEPESDVRIDEPEGPPDDEAHGGGGGKVW